MKEFLTRPIGNSYIRCQCLATPAGLKKGEIVFSMQTGGTPGDINRDVSHVMIVTKDVTDGRHVTYCGHTNDWLDRVHEFDDRKAVYLRLDDWIYDEFTTYQYADSEDRRTANLSFGMDTLKYVTPIVAKDEVKNLQTRLNYPGFNCGTADGKFGQNTKNAVMAFQRSFTHFKCTLAVDGKAGRQTKEALNFPKSYSAG